MRPPEELREEPRFECYRCGARPDDATSRACPECGGRLRNIAAPRDL